MLINCTGSILLSCVVHANIQRGNIFRNVLTLLNMITCAAE